MGKRPPVVDADNRAFYCKTGFSLKVIGESSHNHLRFREGAESCIVLLVLALGQASLRGSISRIVPQEDPPGLQYFTAAWSLLRLQASLSREAREGPMDWVGRYRLTCRCPCAVEVEVCVCVCTVAPASSSAGRFARWMDGRCCCCCCCCWVPLYLFLLSGWAAAAGGWFKVD